MDSDHFVPIWTIACMEDIKALTTDMDLILDVLRGISAAALPVFVRNAHRFSDTLVYRKNPYKMLYINVKLKILSHKWNGICVNNGKW